MLSRLTEVSEEDVYLCDAKYHEDEKMIKKLNKPLSINKVFRENHFTSLNCINWTQDKMYIINCNKSN